MTNATTFLAPIVITLATVVGCGDQALDVGDTKPNGAAGASNAGGSNDSGGNDSSEPSAGAGGSKVSGGASAGGRAAGGSVAVGGSAPVGGSEAAGGAADDAGGACGCAPDDPELEPVRVIRGSGPDSDYWDLKLVGEGLEDHEGKVVTVRLGSPARVEERLGSGQARIADGTFQLTFPKVWEANVYKLKRVFIDANDDGVCTPDVDLIYQDATASEFHVMYITPNHQDVEPSFWPSFSPESDCEELNAPWPTE